MKNIALSLLVFASTSFAALPETVHYWGLADHTPKGGPVTKVFVLGTRVEDRANQTISDTQLYVSESGSVSETKFVFDFKGKKMTSFEGEKVTGGGTVHCDGTVEKHTTCKYEYKTEGADAYRAVGRDVIGKKGVLYREESDIVYANNPKAIPYNVDYFAIKPEAYQALRTKLLAK